MIKCLVTPGTYTSGNIPVSVQQNTNNKYHLDTNDYTIDIRTSGLTEIKGNVVVTATSTAAVTLQVYANGVPVDGAIDTQSLTSGSTYTFHVNDIVKTIYQMDPSYANISLRLSGAGTLVGGDLILAFER